MKLLPRFVIAVQLLFLSSVAHAQDECAGGQPCPATLDLFSDESPQVPSNRGRQSEFPPQPCASNLKCKKRDEKDCENVGILNTSIGFIPVISILDAGGALVIFSSDIIPNPVLFLDNDEPDLGVLFRPAGAAFTGTPDNRAFLISLILAPKVRPPARLEPPPYIFGFDFALYNRPSFDPVPLQTILYRQGTFRNGTCDLENVFRPIPEELLTVVESNLFFDARENPVVIISLDLTIYRLRVTFETDAECAAFIFSTTTPCCSLQDAKFKDPGCNRLNSN
ncbi:unnamed protein product [Agarophyton chilense]